MYKDLRVSNVSEDKYNIFCISIDVQTTNKFNIVRLVKVKALLLLIEVLLTVDIRENR